MKAPGFQGKGKGVLTSRNQGGSQRPDLNCILGLMGAPEKSLGEQMVWEGLMA